MNTPTNTPTKNLAAPHNTPANDAPNINGYANANTPSPYTPVWLTPALSLTKSERAYLGRAEKDFFTTVSAELKITPTEEVIVVTSAEQLNIELDKAPKLPPKKLKF